jgi:superfamily I DNA and/or RNA helicase
MAIHTTNEEFKFGKLGMNWVNVSGSMHEAKNINIAEVNKCVDLANSLASQYPDASIGIITPFRDQCKAISEKLPQVIREKVKPDTVHRYQGDEKDIIILSLVVTEDSPSSKAKFINSNYYLLNVAITRARSSLYIVGDNSYCGKLRDNKIRTPLSLLADYAKSLGKVS